METLCRIVLIEVCFVYIFPLFLADTGEHYPAYQERFDEPQVTIGKRRTRMLGMLLSGLASYDETIASEAFIVLGHNLFASDMLTLQQKYEVFRTIYKRMLILIHDKPLTGLSFLNRAGSLNYIYRFRHYKWRCR